MLQTIQVNGLKITLQTINQNDYFSLTDLAKFKSKDHLSKQVIQNWIYNSFSSHLGNDG